MREFPEHGSQYPLGCRSGADIPTMRVKAMGVALAAALVAGGLSVAGCSQPASEAGRTASHAGSSARDDQDGLRLPIIVEKPSASADAGADAAQEQPQPEETPEQKVAELQAKLDQQVSAIESTGAHISYYVMEVATGRSLEHDADRAYYSASSVKAPYCISLVRAKGAGARQAYGNLIEQTLRNSDNDSYRELRTKFYGQAFYPDFMSEAGFKVDARYWYTNYSTRQLAQIWAHADSWLSSGDGNASWVAGLLRDTLNSQIDDVAGTNGTVTWSKAGWISGDPKLNVAFDAGIVKAASGDYAIAVATDRGSDLNAVRSVLEPLVALWNEQAAQQTAGQGQQAAGAGQRAGQ